MLRPILIATVAVSAAGIATAAEPFASDCLRAVVRVRYEGAAQLDALAAWNEPWEVDRAQGVALVEVDAEGFARLLAAGFEPEVDVSRTLELCSPQRPRAGQSAGIPGFPCYRTVDETLAAAAALAVSHPGLVELVDVGDSWEKTAGLGGDDLLVLRLSNRSVAGTSTGDQPPHGKPKLVVTSAIHAREYTTAELALRFAESLLDGYGSAADDTWLLDEHEIHLLLHANPDGRRQAETGQPWRKNTNRDYCGPTSLSRGADLNRNFSFGWACCGGSSSWECDGTYHGPAPASEPEVAAIQAYLQSVLPDQRGPSSSDAAPADATGVYLDVHSYGELVLWPWGTGSAPAPNAPALGTLGRRLAWFNGYEPGQSNSLYVTDGTTDDFAYGELGVGAFVFELGTSFFQDCAGFESTILPDNLRALRYLAKVARTPYLTPGGPEIVEMLATPAILAPGEVATLSATADDRRFSALGGAEPVHAVAEVAATVDSPPWREPTPAGVPLAADDGAYDEPEESVSGVLGTGGLEQGRHTVYVRARDASGAWGPVSATFLWVLDPASAPRIVGVVRDDHTGLPVAATVTAGPFSTTSDPATGSYQLQVPAGGWTVTAEAEGYRCESATDVSVADGVVTVVDLHLVPFTTVLEDDVELGTGDWTASPPWAITSEDAASPSHSWTDSPGGDYASSRDTSLMSPILDLAGVTGVSIRFAHRYSTEDGWDFCRLEASPDGGTSWLEVARWHGDSGGWAVEELSAPVLDGASRARIRFRFISDSSTTDDGWHVDDIVIRGVSPSGRLFADGFESGATEAWTVP